MLRVMDKYLISYLNSEDLYGLGGINFYLRIKITYAVHERVK